MNSSPSSLVMMSSHEDKSSGMECLSIDERCREEREGMEVVSWLIVRPSFVRQALRKLILAASSSASALTREGYSGPLDLESRLIAANLNILVK